MVRVSGAAASRWSAIGPLVARERSNPGRVRPELALPEKFFVTFVNTLFLREESVTAVRLASAVRYASPCPVVTTPSTGDGVVG
jgi:hypothetical protein